MSEEWSASHTRRGGSSRRHGGTLLSSSFPPIKVAPGLERAALKAPHSSMDLLPDTSSQSVGLTVASHVTPMLRAYHRYRLCIPPPARQARDLQSLRPNRRGTSLAAPAVHDNPSSPISCRCDPHFTQPAFPPVDPDSIPTVTTSSVRSR